MKVTILKEVDVTHLSCSVEPRYWEDAKANGFAIEEDAYIPCRKGFLWEPVINLETGQIENWEQGNTADIHFKVCDCGTYRLLDDKQNLVTSIDGYVPEMMSPGGDGYGDYVIMSIDSEGYIQNWRADLSEFQRKAYD